MLKPQPLRRLVASDRANCHRTPALAVLTLTEQPSNPGVMPALRADDRSFGAWTIYRRITPTTHHGGNHGYAASSEPFNSTR